MNMDTIDVDEDGVITEHRTTAIIEAPTYRRSDDIAELFTALGKAQGSFGLAERAGVNPAFRRDGKAGTYATLGAVIEATRKGLSENGLSVIQMPTNGAGTNIAVTTLLCHTSGQWMESTFWVAPAQFTAPAAGSVITYLRRYALMAIAGIAPEDDDDGNAAVAAPQQTATRATPAVAPASTSRQVASAAATRIRSDIKGARSLADLNRTGVFSEQSKDDKAKILAETGGDKVWTSLLNMDAARRLEFTGTNSSGDFPDDPIPDLAPDNYLAPQDKDYRI